MQVQQDISLKTLNTFGIDTTAQYSAVISAVSELPELSALQGYGKKHILGGGSNVLLTGPVTGLLLLNRLKGKEVLREDGHQVWLKVASGEVWHELVLYTIDQGWSGLENLALIPGTVGAAPIQNIGAYGAEVKDVIETVHYWHWQDAALYTLSNADCHFGYRDSIFKQELKGLVFVTDVVFRLNKQARPNTAYGAIREELERMQVAELSAKAVAEAVIRIRSSKLPDPKQIGNAGSFFKNPVIPMQQFERLQQDYADIPSYNAGPGMVKVPAGWLIEKAGWKGVREGDTGVHSKQALVLVNYGQATGGEIWELSSRIVASIQKRFGIELEREVQVW